jgi:hypothetical protein
MKQVWEWWKSVGKKVGDLQARGLLILFYFLILGPFAILVRTMSDPLAIKANPVGWRPRPNQGEGLPLERALRQF